MKIILIVLLFTSLLSSKSNNIVSDTFTFSKSKSLDNHINQKQIVSTKAIIATGYGINKDEALKSAFKSAVEQYVGVLVDANTVVKNQRIIKDEILTASNGYIQSYDEVSIEKNDDIVQVKIKAVVKSQKVFNKVKSLNIDIVTINNSSDAYARVVTKLSRKQDAEQMLQKVLGNFFSTKSLKEMLQIDIKDVQVLDNEAKGAKVPINISYVVKINYKIYAQKIKHIEDVFKNLGANLHKKVHMPIYSNAGLRCKGTCSLGHKFKSATYFGFIKTYGNKHKLDLWEFPKSWNDIYPFNNNIHNYPEKSRYRYYSATKCGLYWYDLFKMILEIKNSTGEILLVDNEADRNWRGRLVLLTAEASNRQYAATFRGGKAKIVIPFFIYAINGYHTYPEIKYTIKEFIDIDKVKEIKNISLRIEDK